MLAAILHSDGGSRGNPGPAGCGFELLDGATGDALACAGTFLGTASNNVAEYSALVWGMQNALAAGV
ncbi:MAG: reverse transcriptase-like protein, partial [Raoultibacter sp.]